MKNLSHYFFAALVLPASLWAATISGQVRVNTVTGIGVAGAKVVLINGATNGTRIDSTVTDSAGNYSMTGVKVTAGARTVYVSKSGYNPNAALFTIPTDTSHVTANMIITINNKTTVFTGFVRRASDSTPIAGATVTISGCGFDPPISRTVLTDSLGKYRVDSANTGINPPGCTVSAAKTLFALASTGGVSSPWNTTVTVPTFYLIQNSGTLAGVVRSTGTGTPAIAGAKVVVSTGSARVDSATTNATGQFTFSLSAATYSISVSSLTTVPVYKDSTGLAVQTLSAAVSFGATTNLVINLVPATSTIAGTIRVASPTGPFLEGAKIVLQRRIITSSSFLTLDSTLSDVNGIFVFSNLIAASGVGGQNYRLQIGKIGPPTYGASATNPAPVITANMTLAMGATYNVNYSLGIYTGTPILPHVSGENGIRFTTVGEKLMLDLGDSKAIRTVSVLDMKGSLKYKVSVAAGESKASLPAGFAPEKGFVFQVR